MIQEATAEPDTIEPFPTPEDGRAPGAPPEYQAAEEIAPQELGLAEDVFRELNDNARKLSDQRVVDGLIQIVDVHQIFRTVQDLFKNRDADAPKFEGASVPAEIARLLCRGCSKIEAPYRRLVFYWKDHEKWTSNGQVVDGVVKRFDGFHQFRNEGVVAALIFNYHRWLVLNPRQKVFTVYRLLRSMQADGSARAPDWVGYFDEPALFGAGVHREMVTMARAFVKDAPSRAGDPYQLSMLDEVYDG